MALTLTTDERAELERRVRSLKIRAEDARRARVILMLAEGESYSTIEATVPCYRDYINRWRRRFLPDRLDGLRARLPRTAGDGAEPGDGSPGIGEDPAPAARRRYPLEYAEAGRVLQIHHNLVAKAWQRARSIWTQREVNCLESRGAKNRPAKE